MFKNFFKYVMLGAFVVVLNGCATSDRNNALVDQYTKRRSLHAAINGLGRDDNERVHLFLT